MVFHPGYVGDLTRSGADALREWAGRLAVRWGRSITVVALARRLAGILYAMLRDGTLTWSRSS